jgi:hypothetical protein
MNLNQNQVDALNALRDKDGTINANDVVEEGRKKSSVLHTLFDWDVNRVHERYLLARAEEIIRSCPYEVHYEDIEVPIPRYRHDPSPEADIGSYVDVAVASREKNADILAKLLARIQNLITDAKNHATVSGLMNEFRSGLVEITNEALEVEKKPPGRLRRRRGEDRPRVAT